MVEVLLPIADDIQERERITKDIRDIFRKKMEAKGVINELKEKFGNLTT